MSDSPQESQKCHLSKIRPHGLANLHGLADRLRPSAVSSRRQSAKDALDFFGCIFCGLRRRRARSLHPRQPRNDQVNGKALHSRWEGMCPTAACRSCPTCAGRRSRSSANSAADAGVRSSSLLPAHWRRWPLPPVGGAVRHLNRLRRQPAAATSLRRRVDPLI